MSTISIPEDFCPSLETLHVSHDDVLEEIRTLPRTVKTISLEDCKGLKDTGVNGGLRNLRSLTIRRCPELAELPSFAEFASMKKIDIRECQISGKMEGLEQLTSLESLDLHTQWEVPGIISLEHAHGLRGLRLSADNIGDLEPCIKTLQIWPEEVIICARASGGVESLVKAFTSTNLIVVEACADSDDGAYRNDKSEKDRGALETQRNDEDNKDDGEEHADEDGCRLKYRKTCCSVYPYERRRNKWILGGPKTCLSHHGEATVVCFVINCLPQDAVEVLVRSYMDPFYKIKLSEGKWVCMCVISWRTFAEPQLKIKLNIRE